MKVLLIYSNIVKESWIPIGLLYIASNLRKNNIDVKIADTKYDNIFSIIDDYKPSIIGLGGMTVMAPNAIKLGKEIKSKYPNIILVYGGVHFTFIPEDAFEVANIVIKGESENTLVELCNSIEIMSELYPGRIVNKKLINSKLIENLDELPFPAYDLIDINKYSDELITGEKAISILTGRGCPYNCSFCASPKLWKRKVRYHSIEYTIDHIKYLINKCNIKNLRIMDDTFTVDNTRVMQFCEAIQKNNIKLKMTCLTNVHNANLEVFKEMRKAGFEIVAFGLESADPLVLKLANKDNTEENMRNAVNLAHKAGLLTELLFMIGNPGETKESINHSLDFAKSLNGYKTYFQLATPFPGSYFYDIAEQYGKVLDRNWEEYTHKKIKYIPNGLDEEIMYNACKEGTNE